MRDLQYVMRVRAQQGPMVLEVIIGIIATKILCRSIRSGWRASTIPPFSILLILFLHYLANASSPLINSLSAGLHFTRSPKEEKWWKTVSNNSLSLSIPRCFCSFVVLSVSVNVATTTAGWMRFYFP